MRRQPCSLTSPRLSTTAKEHPGHAASKARLAEAYSLRVMHLVVPSRPDLELARQWANEALSSSPHLWEAHSVLGAAHTCLDWDWKGAQRAFSEALRVAEG